MPHPHHSRFGDSPKSRPTVLPSASSDSTFRFTRHPRSASSPTPDVDPYERRMGGLTTSQSSMTLAGDAGRPSEVVSGLPPRAMSLYSQHDEVSGYGDFSPSLYLYEHDSPFSAVQTPTGIEGGDVVGEREAGVGDSKTSTHALVDPFFSPCARRPSMTKRSTGSYISSRLSVRPKTAGSDFLSYRSSTSEPPSPTESIASSSSSFSSSCLPPPLPDLEPSLFHDDDDLSTSHGSTATHGYHYRSRQTFPGLAPNPVHTNSNSSSNTVASTLDSRSTSPCSPPSPLQPIASPTKEGYADSLRRHTRQMMFMAGGRQFESPEKTGGKVVDPGPSPRARKPDAWKGALFRGTMVYQADNDAEPAF